MAAVTDLMGLGMPPRLAGLIATTPSSVTAAGTTAGAATQITTKMCEVSSATSATGAIVPNVSPGEYGFINCKTGSTASAVIYPPTGSSATFNNASSVTLAADKSMIWWRFSTTKFFYVILA